MLKTALINRIHPLVSLKALITAFLLMSLQLTLVGCLNKNESALTEDGELIQKLDEKEYVNTLIYRTIKNLDTNPLMSKISHETDSILNEVSVLQLTFNENDSLTFSGLKTSGSYVDNYTARKFFTGDSLPMQDEPVYPTVYDLGKYHAYTVNDPEVHPEFNLYIASETIMIGFIHIIAGSDFKIETLSNQKDSLTICFRYNLGSGSGITWDEYFCYSVSENGIRPVFHYPAEVSSGMAEDINRTWSCESVLKRNEKTTISYQLHSWLLSTATEMELVRDSFSIDPFNITDREKMLAMNASYFSDLTEVLFLHAYRKELLRIYLVATPERKKMLLEYFRHSLFKKKDAASQTDVNL